MHVLSCAGVRALGFDHVSDDDFARVTIAQAFAHAPRLDPSGTSWLPFPFWLLGSMLGAFGRTLQVARFASIALASVAFPAPYVALRFVGVARSVALAASALTLGSAWALWLGAATVPESFTASFTAAAAIGLGALPRTGISRRTSIGLALMLLAAGLSRYETWPVALVLLGMTAVRRLRSGGTARPSFADLAVVALPLAAPLLWMAWNAHAHDGPLHFFRRVANYRRALGGSESSVLEAALQYPRLLFLDRPELAVPVIVALGSWRSVDFRRWATPLACAAAVLAFLSYGNMRDGAPTHHPERALLPVQTILAAFVADVLVLRLGDLWTRGRAVTAIGVVVFCAAWLVPLAGRLGDPPGNTPSDDRRAQLERGRELARTGAAAVRLTPCSFEHFATIAAYGAPERVEILPSKHAPVTADCPIIDRP